jgi:hypothetical protein
MWKHLAALIVLSVVLYPKAVSADDSAKPDPRLDAQVTIDCVNVRLYTALDRISAQTKVTIRAGRNANDWPVRDMPLLVCARDIPLGKLLRGIADATHLLLSESPVDSVSTYRIWRDAKREKEISDFEESRKAAARAAASHDWDTLSKVKDIPRDQFKGTQFGGLVHQNVYPMSDLISRLGSDARERVMDGEKMVFGMSNSPAGIKPYVMACIQAFYDNVVELRNENGEPAPKPLDEILNSCHINIQFGRFGEYPDKLCTEINLEGLDTYTQVNPESYQRPAEKLLPDLPPRPKVPDPKLKRDDIDPRYKKLVLDEHGPSFLDTKLKLDRPKDGQKLTYSDLLCAVSKTTGYSIVAEGNAARYVGLVMSLDDELTAILAGKEVTVREALEFGTDLNREVWYLDEANKLIVGRDDEWIETVKSLVPEKLLKETSAKLNGNGMDLDDLLPFSGLSKEQARAWIWNCPEYPAVQAASHSFAALMAGSSLWAFYAALDPTDRATARSGKPVDLSSLDHAWTSSIMRRYLAGDAERRYMNARIAGPPQTMDPAAFINPEASPALSLWVEKKELPEVKGKDLYIVHVKSLKDGASQEITESLSALLPLFAPGKDPVLQKLKEKKQSSGNG